MDEAPLPNAQDAIRARADAAQRVSGEEDTHWDDSSVMDSSTAHLLSFAGMRCRVIGTFYLDRPPDDRVATQEPRVAPYGMKQLYLSDPDGYNLCFQWRAV